MGKPCFWVIQMQDATINTANNCRLRKRELGFPASRPSITPENYEFVTGYRRQSSGGAVPIKGAGPDRRVGCSDTQAAASPRGPKGASTYQVSTGSRKYLSAYVGGKSTAVGMGKRINGVGSSRLDIRGTTQFGWRGTVSVNAQGFRGGAGPSVERRNWREQPTIGRLPPAGLRRP